VAYTLCILVGIALAFVVRRLAPELRPPHHQALSLIAIVGALGGAVLFELPADFYGWSAGVAGEPIVTHAMGGRTVVGGMLGGWLAVEAGKWGLGIKQPTGDGFALSLAVGLACGRLGCFFAGCCAGRTLEGDPWWSELALPGRDGLLRFPAQLAEVGFHALAAVVLFVLARAGELRTRRFAAYVALYAAFRFAIETVRDNPPLALRLTYYQWLALPLFALAAGTFVARRPRGAGSLQRA
jgi:phosphatidylglycerol---prolipoprotein diacylglyceryl transferase